MSQADFRRRVEAAAAEVLARQQFVTPVDVCVGLGWLHQSNLDDWRRGRVDDLEYFLPVHDERLIDLVVYLHEWAQARGLTRTDADYVSATRDRRRLRFFTNGEPIEEAAWRSQWISADVPAGRRERIVERQAAPPDLVVVQPVKDWTCAECGGTGDLLHHGRQGTALPGVRRPGSPGVPAGRRRRDEARDRVKPDIDRVLNAWRGADLYEAFEPSG